MEQLWAVWLRYGSEIFTGVCFKVLELLWAQENLYSACPMHFSGMCGYALSFCLVVGVVILCMCCIVEHGEKLINNLWI